MVVVVVRGGTDSDMRSSVSKWFGLVITPKGEDNLGQPKSPVGLKSTLRGVEGQHEDVGSARNPPPRRRSLSQRAPGIQEQQWHAFERTPGSLACTTGGGA